MKRKIVSGFVCAIFVLVNAAPAYAGGGKSASWTDSVIDKYRQGENIQFQSTQYEPYFMQSSGEFQEFNGDQANQQQIRQTLSPNSRSAANAVIAAPAPNTVNNEIIAANESAVYQSEYKVDIDEDLAFVKGQVVLEVLKTNRPVYIPLVESTVGLKDVTINKKPAIITRRNTKYYVGIDKPGKYNLDLEFFMKVKREREGGPGAVNVDVISSPISIFTVEIKQPNMDIFAEPSIKVESKSEKDKTTAVAILPYAERVNIHWSKSLVKEALPDIKLEPKVYAHTATLVSLGEGVARCTTSIDYSILQSEIAHLEIALPQDVSVVDVQGANLRDWKAGLKNNAQTIDVYLNYGVKGPYNLAVTYERIIGAGSATAQIPAIKLVGAERETGFLGIESRSNVEVILQENKLKGAGIVDRKELPSQIWNYAANPVLMGIKYTESPYEIVVDVVKHNEVPVMVAMVDQAQYTMLVTKDGKVLTRAVYTTRNNDKQFLKVTLPKGAELWTCQVDNRSIKPGQDQQGNILIPLKKSQADADTLNQFPVEVIYLAKTNALGKYGDLEFALAKLDLPQSALTWNVFLPEKYMYYDFKGDVEKTGRQSYGYQTQAIRGEQFNVKDSSYARESRTVAQEAKKAFSKAAGVLPIKIDIPAQGRLYRFTKLLVTNEASTLKLKYVTEHARLAGLGAALVILVILIVALLGRKPRHVKVEG